MYLCVYVTERPLLFLNFGSQPTTDLCVMNTCFTAGTQASLPLLCVAWELPISVLKTRSQYTAVAADSHYGSLLAYWALGGPSSALFLKYLTPYFHIAGMFAYAWPVLRLFKRIYHNVLFTLGTEVLKHERFTNFEPQARACLRKN
jgi:hypothetical protein